MTRFLLPALAVLTLACSGEETPGAAADDPPPAAPEPFPPAARAPVLAPGAAQSWRVIEVPRLPAYFQTAGWAGNDHIWGVARSRPVRAAVDSPAVLTLRGTAWGAFTGPDGSVAWTNERGLWLAPFDGSTAELLVDRVQAHPVSEGGPPAEALWSPAGDRVLLGWTLEWDAVYSLVTPGDDDVRHLETLIPGTFLKTAELWLDSTRVLFAVRANRSLAGEQEYGEGYRADLAVLDVETGDFRTVTAVGDGEFLDALGWLGSELLVTERDGANQPVRHWAYDPGTWQRRPFDAPAARLHPAPRSARVLVRQRLAESVDTLTVGLSLIEGGTLRTLGTARAQQFDSFWSPDGRKLLLRVDYRAYVVEPVQ